MEMRNDGRSAHELRPLRVQYGWSRYADGSVLLEMGGTKVLVSVSLQAGVPSFLKGKGTGWLTAEYGLLPAATHVRSARDAGSNKRMSRSVEISRFIGRALRSVMRFDLLGERTVMIDCDVLQADGGTRVASVIGASMALRAAQSAWLRTNVLKVPVMTDDVVAVSVGWTDDGALLDITYREDSSVRADFNVVLTHSGKLIELQGAAETGLLSWDDFEAVRQCAIHGAQELALWAARQEELRQSGSCGSVDGLDFTSLHSL